MIRIKDISFLSVDGLQPGNTSPAACIPGKSVVLINKPEFSKLTRQQKHFVTLHEIGHLKSMPDTSEIAADNYAFTVYAATGRDLRELWGVMVEILPTHPAKLPPHVPVSERMKVVNAARARMQNMYKNIKLFTLQQQQNGRIYKGRKR